MWTPIPAEPAVTAEQLKQVLKEEFTKFANEIISVRFKELRLQVRKDIRAECQKSMQGPAAAPPGSANVSSAIDAVKKRMSVASALVDQSLVQSAATTPNPSPTSGVVTVAVPEAAPNKLPRREEPRPILRRRGYTAGQVKGKRFTMIPQANIHEQERDISDDADEAANGAVDADADGYKKSARELKAAEQNEIGEHAAEASASAAVPTPRVDEPLLGVEQQVTNGTSDPVNGSKSSLAMEDGKGEVLMDMAAHPGGEEPLASSDMSLPLLGVGDAFDESTQGKCQRTLLGIVNSHVFEYSAGAAVLLNAMVLGFEANYQVAPHEIMPMWVHPIELLFAFVFTAELSIRVAAHGFKEFFLGDGNAWNIFDTLMVAIQLADQVLNVLWADFPDNVSVMRTFRVLRILRITRAFRMVRLFDVLTTVVSQMVNSVLPAFWAFVVFMMMVYVFSVLFMTASTDAGHDALSEDMVVWFGSLERTVITLIECLVGGVEWEDVLRPLVHDVSPFMGVLFAIYIAIGLFVVMNLVVSVFMHKVMMMVREDKDQKMAEQIGQIFLQEGGHNQITCEDFLEKLKEPVLQEYFKAIDVFPSIDEARGLFDLIDVEGIGSVHADEIVDGILRLRGPARALEVAFLLRTTGRICDQLTVQLAAVEAVPAVVRDVVIASAEEAGHVMALKHDDRDADATHQDDRDETIS